MIYKVYLSTKVISSKLAKGSGILVLEPDDYSPEEIQAIRKKGYKPLAYLSVGSLEKERPWFKTFSKYKLKKLDNWPNEYYIDVRKTSWRKFLIERATKLKEKGFAGWWCDNIDVYSEYKSRGMFTAIASVLQKLKDIKGYVMINGGSEWVDDAIDRGENLKKYINGYTQEEVFSRVISYSSEGKFGKQNPEDSRFYRKLLKKTVKKGTSGFMLEYTRDEKLKERIREWGKENKVSYYITENVKL